MYFARAKHVADIMSWKVFHLQIQYLCSLLVFASGQAKYALGVHEYKLGATIQEQLSIPCVCNDLVNLLLRMSLMCIHIKSCVYAYYLRHLHSKDFLATGVSY